MANTARGRLIDLSHVIVEGMTTYKGLPGPQMCDFWSREQSRAFYDDGSTFQIGRIDMIANTGTYLDTPFHRFEDGDDLAMVGIDRVAGLLGVVVRSGAMAVDVADFAAIEVTGKAVLIATGWDRHWGSDAYFDNHPFVTEAAAHWLIDNGAALVGIDSHNIDDTRSRSRPVHSALLGAGIPICEHLTRLGEVPDAGFRFTAAPPKIGGMGTFAVRAFAQVD